VSSSVILVVALRGTSFEGGGRKSVTLSPIRSGSSVYFIFLLIAFFPLSPVACSKNPDPLAAIAEANRENMSVNKAKAEEPFLSSFMDKVTDDHAPWIGKGTLSRLERNPMLVLVEAVLDFIPSIKVRGRIHREPYILMAH
jgi:hypothetical protein